MIAFIVSSIFLFIHFLLIVIRIVECIINGYFIVDENDKKTILRNRSNWRT